MLLSADKEAAIFIKPNEESIYDEENDSTDEVTNGVKIELVSTKEGSRGKGKAKELIQKVADWADKNDTDLHLDIAPQDESTTESGLKKLYESFGFEFDDIHGIRKPNKPTTAVTNDATGGKKLSFSEVPVFVASREEGKKAEGQIVEVLSNLGLGQVLSNSDGEIKIVTEKSTDKKGNTLIGITTFEREEDGSLRQTSDTVFAKKNADGKASSDYNPHTTARDNSGKQITVTDEITDDFIDLSKENVMVTDKDGNLVKTEAFSTFKIADQKPTAVTNDALKDVESTAKALDADKIKQIEATTNLDADPATLNEGTTPAQYVASIYHLSKADGSNPELVKAVESALATNTVEQTTKNNNDAIQEQTANESVLRTEQPEMGLQEVGEGNTKSESVTEQVKTTAKEETVTPIQRITGNKDAITLSGLTEVERQKQIIERDNSLKLSKAKEDESKLSEQVRRFNEMRRNDAKRPRLLNDIKKQALEQGFEVKYNGVSVEVFKKNKSGKPTKINFYLSDIGRRSVTDEKALHERSEAVQELYVKLMDLDIDLDARNSDDNSRFSESQIQSAITDIENGIPSRQANEILNKVEKLAETGKLEVGDKVSGYKSIPIDELITEAEAVRDEQLFKDLTNDEVFELYANDILASNENDNIINQEYERINNEGAVSNTPQKIATNSGGTNEKTPNEEGTNKATSNKTQESGIVPDKIVPETSIVETGKKIADAIRKLKSDKDSLQTDLTLGLKNLALEEIAQLIEDGAVVIDAITKVLSDAKYNSIDKDEIKKIALSPIVLGSGKKVSYFHSNTTGIYGKLRLRNKSGFFGIYFSPSKQYSKKFGDFTYKTDLYPQNTLTIKDKSEFKKYGNIFNISKDSYDSLIKEGYDSIAWYRDGKLMEFIVLDTDIIGDMDLHFLNHPTKTSKSEKNLSLADKIRALKSPKGSLQTDLTLGLKNLALEEIAQLVEDGAQVIDAIAQVLKNAKYNSLNPDDLNKEIVRKLAPISEQNKAFLDNVIKDIESGKTTLEEAVKELNDDLPKRFAEKYIKYLNDNYTPKQEIKNEKTEEAKTKTEVLSEKTSNGNTRDENDFIHEILSKEINETEYPLIAQDVNGSAKQETAKTQGEVQDRSVDGNYVKVTIENLKEIALETSKKLEDKFGDKWVEKTLNFLESRSVSNAQMIGVLNAMSTKVMDDMKATDLSEGKYNSLRAIQKRIDNATNKISRIASIALNMRKVLRKFAEGGNINEVLAQVVLTNEVRAEMKAIDESIKRIKTDEEINNATTPTNPKGTQKTSTQSSKSQTSKEELLSNVTSKADEYRQKTGRTQKNLRSTMKDIAERIKKNCK